MLKLVLRKDKLKREIKVLLFWLYKVNMSHEELCLMIPKIVQLGGIYRFRLRTKGRTLIIKSGDKMIVMPFCFPHSPRQSTFDFF